MWKESYKIGVHRIDQQHMALFKQTETLLNAIKNNQEDYDYKKVVAFLKDYVIFHFRDEEEYQRSIGYQQHLEHKAVHNEFTAVISNFEKRLMETNYDLVIMKELLGTLVSWLIYHVANTDQKMAVNFKTHDPDQTNSVLDVFTSSICETFQSIAGLKSDTIIQKEFVGTLNAQGNDIPVQIGIKGALNGNLYLNFEKEFSLNLFQSMTGLMPETVDEMVCSALAEITNISIGNSTVKLSANQVACDIVPPNVLIEQRDKKQFGGIHMNTELGCLVFSAELEEYESVLNAFI